MVWLQLEELTIWVGVVLPIGWLKSWIVVRIDGWEWIELLEIFDAGKHGASTEEPGEFMVGAHVGFGVGPDVDVVTRDLDGRGSQ